MAQVRVAKISLYRKKKWWKRLSFFIFRRSEFGAISPITNCIFDFGPWVKQSQ